MTEPITNDRILEPLPGVRYACSSELEEWRASSLLSKEPETLAWLDRELSGSPERVLFDVGANVGSYAVYAAARHGAEVYAFEPVVESFVRLERNRALNGCERLHPFQVAIGARSGLVDLYVRDGRVGNSGAQILAPVDEHGARFSPVASRKVLAVSIDELVRDFDLPCPALIKIDIDGLEDLVLEGAAQTLRRGELRSILVELNSPAAVARTTALLGGHGFARDAELDALPTHSSKRRRQSSANVAENVVFTREAG